MSALICIGGRADGQQWHIEPGRRDTMVPCKSHRLAISYDPSRFPETVEEIPRDFYVVEMLRFGDGIPPVRFLRHHEMTRRDAFEALLKRYAPAHEVQAE